MRKKVAIVGSHPTNRDDAPFYNDEYDIWVFNEAISGGFVKGATGLFQMHVPPIWRNPNNINDKNHYGWLQQKHDIPIWMMENFPDVPDSICYPLDEIALSLTPHLYKGDKRIRYFSSSAAYAVALAIWLGYEQIEIYGIEMVTETEYGPQQGGLYFWLGVATGRGITVKMHASSALFSSFLYGYEGDITLTPEELLERIESNSKELAEHKTLVEQSMGTIKGYVDAAMRAKDNKTKDTILQKVHSLVQEHSKLIAKAGFLEGRLYELSRYYERATNNAERFIFSPQEFEGIAVSITKQLPEKEREYQEQTPKTNRAWEKVNKVKNEQTLTVFMKQYQKTVNAIFALNKMLGARQENQALREILNRKILAAGGSKSEAVLKALE